MPTDVVHLQLCPALDTMCPLEKQEQGETLRKLPKDKSQSFNSSVESRTLWDVASSLKGEPGDFSSSAYPTVSLSKAGALSSA